MELDSSAPVPVPEPDVLGDYLAGGWKVDAPCDDTPQAEPEEPSEVVVMVGFDGREYTDDEIDVMTSAERDLLFRAEIGRLRAYLPLLTRLAAFESFAGTVPAGVAS